MLWYLWFCHILHKAFITSGLVQNKDALPEHQYRNSHYGCKTILRWSYLHNGISYTGKTTSLYWIRAQDSQCVAQWLVDASASNHDHDLTHWPPEDADNNLKLVIFKLISWIDILSISCEVAWGKCHKSSLIKNQQMVQVMAWCCQATMN